MATTYKVLGQSSPEMNVLSDLYVTPADMQAVVSTLVICNRGNTTVGSRVAVRAGNAAVEDKHYIVFDLPTPPRDTISLTIGMTLANADVVSVYSTDNANISYTLFGSEIA